MKIKFLPYLFVACIITFSFSKVSAQLFSDGSLSMEAGINAGMMNSMTDLGGKAGAGGKFVKDYAWSTTHMSYGAYYAAMYKNVIGLRLDATFGKVSGTDNADGVVIPDPQNDFYRARQNRNLSFQSKINEISLMAEFHPLGLVTSLLTEEGDGPPVSPYISTGIGFYSFNPQAYNRFGDLVDLQPLCTEGQGFKEYGDRKTYSLKQVNIPFALGVKFNLSNTVRVRTEFVYRKLFTDYLDDVSTTYIDPSTYKNNGFEGTQYFDALEMNNREITKFSVPGSKRGNPSNKDSYFSFNLKVGISLNSLMGGGYSY